MRVLRAFVVAVAVLAAGAAMAPGARAAASWPDRDGQRQRPSRLIVGDTATLTATVTNPTTDDGDATCGCNFIPQAGDPFEDPPT